MKKWTSLMALIVMLSVNVLTPFTYAQGAGETQENNDEISNAIDGESESLTLEESSDKPNVKLQDLPASVKVTFVTNLEDLGSVEVETAQWSPLDSTARESMPKRHYVENWIEFAEWYDNEDLEGNPFDILNTSITEPIKLYAKWMQKITYQTWSIKISDWDKTILIKNVNQGWSSNDIDKYQRIIRLMNDVKYCHEEEVCVSDQKSCEMVFDCTPEFYAQATNILLTGIDNLDQIYGYFTSLYGRYYFRWNNWYAEYDELNFMQYWEIDVDRAAQIRWFLNYSKIQNPDMWWIENQKSQNPCDATKWEYMPTPEDWAELMYTWADINWEYAGNYNPNADAPRKIEANNIDYVRISNPKLFQQDMLIPNAWDVSYRNNKLYYKDLWSFLWTAKNAEWWFGSYNAGLGEFTSYAGTDVAIWVRCFLIENPVTVEFDTDDWSDIEPYEVEGWTTITPPANPTREWYTFEWWYKDSDLAQQWNFDTDVVEDDMTLYAKWRVCGDWFTVIWNKCMPGDIDMNWVIEVSDGVETYYIRDKNVWASAACSPELNQIVELYKNRCDPMNYVDPTEKSIELSQSAQSSIKYSSCIEEDELLAQVNAILDTHMSISELSAYINQEVQNCRWNYYFRWNNIGASYNDFTFDPYDPNYITNTWYLISTWFDGWRMWIPEWSGWIKWNPQDNPCSGTWEYLPTTEDWENLIRVWLNKKESNPDDATLNPDEPVLVPIDEDVIRASAEVPTTFPDPEMFYEFMQDMQISNAWMVRYSNCWQEYVGPEVGPLVSATACEDWMFYNDNSFWLRTAQQDGKIWLFNDFGIFSGTVENMIDNNLNDTALSVRCFVNMDNLEVLVVRLVSDGQETREVNVVSWEKLWEPSVSSRNWYTFEWWYTEEGEKYNFDNLVTEDITLYAKWTQNKSGGHSSWWGGWGSSSSKTDKTDTPAKGENTETSKPTNTPWNVEDSTSDSQADDSKQDSSDRNSVQINDSKSNGNTKWSDFTPEFKEAYNYAKENWITTKSSIESANMYGNLTRIQMAKMLSNYAINVMWLKPDETRVNKFKDVSDKLDEEYNNAVTLSYQLWIMWINMPNNKFRPHDNVPRAEFVAAFSRMLFNTSDWEYKSTSKYYVHHMEKLKSEKILTNDNPTMIERRWYVMLMLMRSATK